MDGHGLQNTRRDADHRRRPRHEARPDPRARRLQRQRAQPADHAAVQGRGRVLVALGNLLHSDVHRRLRRPVGENYYYETTEVHDDPKVRHFIPHNLSGRSHAPPSHLDRTRTSTSSRVWPPQAAKFIKAGGNVCIGSHGQFQGLGYHWEMWSLASRWHRQPGSPAVRHHPRRRGDRPRAGPRLASNRASSPTSSCSIKNPLEDIRNTDIDPLCDEERRTLQGDQRSTKFIRRKKTLAPLWWWSEKP